MRNILKDKKNERFYCYASSYTFSAIRLLETMGKKSGIVTKPFHFNVKKEDVVLPSIFLMSHGIELYLKIFYSKIFEKNPNPKHGIKELLKEIKKFDKNLLKPLKPHLKTIEETGSLYNKVRYPYDREFNNVVLEFNKFLSHWNSRKRSVYLSEFISIRNLLNEITSKILK